MAYQVIINGGKVVHSRVINRIDARIEKGALNAVHALVVHQTGAATSRSVFGSYANGQNGAHFLIDVDGRLYQTARVTQKCWHVGRIRAKCQHLRSCSSTDLAAINQILFRRGDSYAVRIKALHDHEAAKAYPHRYPTNEDSIGIEIVSAFDVRADAYASVNRSQNESLSWLVAALEGALALSDSDVYTHGTIGYKQVSEGATAKWTRP